LGLILAAGVPPRGYSAQGPATPLAKWSNNRHIRSIEFRPNDLASPLTARLT